MTEQMWKSYDVGLEFTTPFASSTPKNPKDIIAMLEAKAPTRPPEDVTPLGELAEQVAAEVGATEEVERGYATFKRDANSIIYYEARCVRAHIKDCANQLQGYLGIKALKAKVANKVYPEPPTIYLNKTKPDATVVKELSPDDPNWKILDTIENPDGNELRIIHAMTMKGPRSSLKVIDYVDCPTMGFRLRVLNDDVITEATLGSIFEYGGIHGMGQERSQDWGKYKVLKLEALD